MTTFSSGPHSTILGLRYASGRCRPTASLNPGQATGGTGLKLILYAKHSWPIYEAQKRDF
jgi:hypothetical protein